MKTRHFDDTHRAGVNVGTLMNETLVMSTFEFIGKVGGHICTTSDNNPEFDLVFDLEDMFEEFRCFDNISDPMNRRQ